MREKQVAYIIHITLKEEIKTEKPPPQPFYGLFRDYPGE